MEGTCQTIEQHFACLQPDEGCGSRAFAGRRYQKLDALCSQPRRLNAVELAWIAALLEMAEYFLAHIDEIAAFFLAERSDEICCIDRVGVLIADDQGQSLVLLETLRELCQVSLQIAKRHSFFMKMTCSAPVAKLLINAG